MTFNRRFPLHVLAAALAVIAMLPAQTLAQTGKKLTILVGFPAGGAVDAVARAMTETLRSAGYTVIVDNKTGAGGRLGFSGDSRLPTLPDVPTFKEQGFPDLTMSEMFVFMANAKTPPALQKELASALSAAVRSKDVTLALEKAEFDPLVMEPEAIGKRLQMETTRWAAVVKSTGYKSED